MKHKLIADSSADRLENFYNIPFVSVPLKINAGEQEFVDDADLDVRQMVTFLDSYRGKSGSACPSVAEYLDAFSGGEEIFCFTITSRLSGSYNAAVMAKQDYESAHPQCKAFVLDTLSAGPEIQLLLERTAEDIQKGMSFDTICADLEEYRTRTALVFSLESLRNLANNGRVSPVVAKLAGVLGIRIVGRASLEGTLEPMDKCRGEKKALQKLQSHMAAIGYKGGKVRINHCNNLTAAQEVANALKAETPDADIIIRETRGLCSFYAENGGLLIGFEL